ncbi:MAG: HD domain-containing protein [bacterium]
MRDILSLLPLEKFEICKKTGEIFARHSERVWLVGGAVRDLWFGKAKEMDLDFVTTACSADIRKIMRRPASAIFDKSVSKGYGTQGIILKNGAEIEITPLRKVQDLKLPADADPFTAPLIADLMSRDFSINAVAIDVTPDGFGAVADPSGGIADVHNRILRTPGPPHAILTDDPVRAIRAVRFAALFSLDIEPRTRGAIIHFATTSPNLIRAVSGERTRLELFKILAAPSPSRAVRLMDDLVILPLILPELAALKGVEPEPGYRHKDLFEHTLGALDRASELRRPAPQPAFMLAVLLHDAGKPAARRMADGRCTFTGHEKAGSEIAEAAARRLRLSLDEIRRVAALVRKHHRLHQYTPEWSDAAVRRALHDLGELYDDAIVFSMADATGQDPERRRRREEHLADFARRVESLDKERVLKPKPPIDGNAIMEILGIKPGPSGGGVVVGKAVKHLTDMVVSGELDADDEAAARRIVANREWEREGDAKNPSGAYN